MSILTNLSWFLAEYRDIMEQARTGRPTRTARRRMQNFPSSTEAADSTKP
jgi:hypothetical protein